MQAEIKGKLSKEGIDMKNIEKLTHKIIDNVSKGLFIGVSGVGMVAGGLICICEFSSSIVLGDVGGGIIGIAIGAVIGGIILGIRAVLRNRQKKDNYIKLLNNAKNYYNSTFDGIKFKVNTRTEETKKFIENLYFIYLNNKYPYIYWCIW